MLFFLNIGPLYSLVYQVVFNNFVFKVHNSDHLISMFTILSNWLNLLNFFNCFTYQDFKVMIKHVVVYFLV